MHGVDARDYLRGTRPWPQFYNYAHTVAKTEGSQLWAAQLADERYWPEFEKQLKDQGREKVPPPLLGYSRLVRSIDDLYDQILLMRAESGSWPHVELKLRPQYPSDVIEERQIVKGRSKVDGIMDEAHGLLNK